MRNVNAATRLMLILTASVPLAFALVGYAASEKSLAGGDIRSALGERFMCGMMCGWALGQILAASLIPEGRREDRPESPGGRDGKGHQDDWCECRIPGQHSQYNGRDEPLTCLTCKRPVRRWPLDYPH